MTARAQLTPAAWRTFAASAPTATHWAPATCAEVDCAAWRHGWAVTLDLSGDDGARSMAAIRAAYRPGQYTVDVTSPVAATVVVFEAGTPCFERNRHIRPLERPPLYVVRDGPAWAGDPRLTAQHGLVLPDGEAWIGEYMDQRDKSLRG